MSDPNKENDFCNRRTRKALKRHKGGWSPRYAYYSNEQQRRLLQREEDRLTTAGYDRWASGWIGGS